MPPERKEKEVGYDSQGAMNKFPESKEDLTKEVVRLEGCCRRMKDVMEDMWDALLTCGVVVKREKGDSNSLYGLIQTALSKYEKLIKQECK